MARAKIHIGIDNFKTEIETGGRSLMADEPEALGGKNAGFAPYDLLLASLGSCTAITLRMYADRKGWDLSAVDIELHHTRIEDKSTIERIVTLCGNLSDEQKTRLAEVAERTPVTRTLKDGADITTSFT